MDRAPAALLIGGTSHVGKSTLARHLARRENWTAASTDQLARHPGRPWTTSSKPLPPHVTEHYGTLTADKLLASVVAHYTSMLPTIVQYIDRQFAEFPSNYLALEGSALTPSNLVHMRFPNVSAIYLTADDALIKDRIQAESRYHALEKSEKALVDTFTERAIRFNDLIVRDAGRFGFPHLHVGDETVLSELAEQCIYSAAGLGK